MTDFARIRLSVFVLLSIALLLLGAGQMLVLPPFEGFDETAHFSSIRQIADTGTIPQPGKSFIAQEVVDYRAMGPLPYNLNWPWNENGGLTYQAFFGDAAKVEAYQKAYDDFTPRKAFAPSVQDNWQAQHPPLYYLLAAPVMKATDGLPFVAQFFALRFFSFLLAFAGLLIGLWGTLKYGDARMRKDIALAFLLYPLIVPQFFPEFGRIGNDSLCLFLMGMAWLLLLQGLKDEFNMKSAFALGFTLGLGLLTKAFFLPITVAVGGFLLWQLWRERSDGAVIKQKFAVLLFLALPILFASFWYFYRWQFNGSVSGSIEVKALQDKGNLLGNFLAHFSLGDTIKRGLAFFLSWIWAGTASLGRLDMVFHLPLLGANAWLFGKYFGRVYSRQQDASAYVPLWLNGLFLVALAGHTLTLIALASGGATPGWYFSILLPAFALAYAYGAREILANKTGRFFLAAAAVYGGGFLIVSVACNMALYSGCATLGDHRIYQFSGSNYCIENFEGIRHNLQLIAFPDAGIACIACGMICYAAAFIKSGCFKRSIT